MNEIISAPIAESKSKAKALAQKTKLREDGGPGAREMTPAAGIGIQEQGHGEVESASVIGRSRGGKD